MELDESPTKFIQNLVALLLINGEIGPIYTHYMLYVISCLLITTSVGHCLFKHALCFASTQLVKVINHNFADDKLMQFRTMFEELYGEEKCTPNMHLHGQIKDCILNYNPVASFWAFAFERYYGVLATIG